LGKVFTDLLKLLVILKIYLKCLLELIDLLNLHFSLINLKQ